jgi:hypothetical protein
MDLAAGRLPHDGLIATTDADSTPAPDWLATQLQAVAAGARAIGGRIDIDDAPEAALARREADAAHRRAALQGSGAREHHHFSGASLAVTSATYTRVGRLEPRHALEDEGFERALRRHGVPIERLAAVRVTTSGRRHGRAPRGLAVDLRRNAWLAERSYDARDYDPDALLAAKHQTVSVIVPTRDVAATLGPILDALRTPLIDELLVVDGHSSDRTIDVATERGVRAITQPHTGKGDAMRHGLAHTTGELVAYLDADTEDFTDAFVLGLLGPLLTQPVDFVKGHFRRPFKHGDTTRPDEGGRVTELLARPYLNLHFPELAGFRQPLAGEVAATRALLERLPFPAGYGIEIAMLIDASRAVGLERMAQVDLGTRQNRHQPLADLSKMALEVLTAAERRTHGASHPGKLLIPTPGDFDARAVLTDEHPPLRSTAPLAQQ